MGSAVDDCSALKCHPRHLCPLGVSVGMVPVVALSSRREAAWMSELGLRDSQQIIKSEDVIPPSLQAETVQGWVVRTARVLHC